MYCVSFLGIVNTEVENVWTMLFVMWFSHPMQCTQSMFIIHIQCVVMYCYSMYFTPTIQYACWECRLIFQWLIAATFFAYICLCFVLSVVYMYANKIESFFVEFVAKKKKKKMHKGLVPGSWHISHVNTLRAQIALLGSCCSIYTSRSCN